MPRFFAVLGYGVIFSVLAAFFAWVVYEMAWHSGSLFRVWKMAVGFGLAAAGLLLGLLLTWIGSRVKRFDRSAGPRRPRWPSSSARRRSPPTPTTGSARSA